MVSFAPNTKPDKDEKSTFSGTSMAPYYEYVQFQHFQDQPSFQPSVQPEVTQRPQTQELVRRLNRTHRPPAYLQDFIVI